MKLIDALKAATAEDLTEIDAQIEALESELATLITARKLVDVAVNGKPAKPERAPRGQGKTAQAKAEKAASLEDRRQKVFDLLSKEGSMPLVAIASKLGIHHIAIAKAIREHEWFEAVAGEWHIRKAARK